jgi:hypothetical protein
MNDPMKDIINRIVPPTPMFGEDEDEEADFGRPPLARRAGPDDDAEASEISAEALDEAERNSEPDDDENDDARYLGDFDEQDYVGRIEGWAFKSLLLFVGDEELEVFYRRPRDAPGTVRWERIGHARSPDALDLRPLLYCAQQRDALEEEQGRREDLIESVFGAGSVPLIESLISRNGGDTAPGTPLTPRQEAFCRHYLTEPSGTRAAIVAGYAESGAKVQAHRLLTNANVLQKISALRRAHALSYTLDRDTMLDKLEAFFEDAMKGESYSAALRALLAQAELGGLLNRRHKAAERAEARARAGAEPSS